MRAALGLVAIAAIGCGDRERPTPVAIPVAAPDPAPAPTPTPAPTPGDAAPAAGGWPELADYPTIAPLHVVSLPARPDVPRFDVGGPVIAGDVAVVASSQFGFIAIDWRSGAIAWSKPAGTHVAPPLVIPDGVVLIGDCLAPPDVGPREQLLGCLRVVAPTGSDRQHIAIRGPAGALAAFAGAPGAQQLWPDGDRAVRWRRGDHAVTIDLGTGVARPAATAAAPPLGFRFRERAWQIAHTDGRLLARNPPSARIAWQTRQRYTALIGMVWTADGFPLVRVADFGTFLREPELHLFDIDALGSLRGQVARPVPGISLLGHAASPIGDAALAIRLDTSLRRDFLVGYAANALLMWVFPLPEVPRADPVGVALAPEAVVVFHDGDTVTILPELSAPPTSLGAHRAPSQNPTP